MDPIDALFRILLSPSGRLLAGVWGALWGSFFNVLIVRLPAQESVVRPSSHCRACTAPIAWYDNIPIVSYLLLRGRCRRCRAPFSPRYILVELLVCALAILMHQLYVVWGTSPLSLRLAQFFITSGFCGILVAVTFIDLDTLKIPNAITYPGIPICMGCSLLLEPARPWDGIVGGICGYGVIWMINTFYGLITGRQGIGFGDAKLLAMIGGLLGWQVLLPTLFLAMLQGTLIGIPVLVLVKLLRKNGMTVQETSGQECFDELHPTSSTSSPSSSSSSSSSSTSSSTPTSSSSSSHRRIQRLGRFLASLRFAALPLGPFLCMASVEVMLLKRILPFIFFAW
jgi:leader peptidase (prepilin peptidase) / N-methyltransferase